VGFVKAGGFRGIYNGLGAAAIGSAPGAALFFTTYEHLKPRLLELNRQVALESRDGSNWYRYGPSACHMIAASMGEVAACLVRVPTEVLKAKMQTSATPLSLNSAFHSVVQEGYAGSSWMVQYTGGLYRGFGMTLFREIPFAMIQFPLYEQFKQQLEVVWQRQQLHYEPGGELNALHLSQLSNVTPLQSAACGSLSGAIAGAITTPLDVLKTRTQVRWDGSRAHCWLEPTTTHAFFCSRIATLAWKGPRWSSVSGRIRRTSKTASDRGQCGLVERHSATRPMDIDRWIRVFRRLRIRSSSPRPSPAVALLVHKTNGNGTHFYVM
jgi:Mitochondrial carrier protein